MVCSSFTGGIFGVKFHAFAAAFILAAVSATSAQAQGLLLAQMQCQANYRGVTFNGVVQVQLLQFAGATGIGSSGERSQMIMLLRSGRANEIPGTLYMLGEFGAPGTIVHIEAPNLVGGSGTGSIVVNGAVHRATYANFAFVPGGIIAVTEDNERIEYRCQ